MTTKFDGTTVKLNGNFVKVGDKSPEFSLVKTDLSTLTLSSLKGKRVILNIFPSLDTGICAASVRHFNQEAAGLDNTVVLAISKDLPFAHARFCTAEGIENVVSLADFRNDDFVKAYGLRMEDGPLAGLLARAVVVLNEKGEVIYQELVPEIKQEPNYNAALSALK